MKLGTGARILFGASAVLFGILTLMWHDPDTWQGLPFLKLPLGGIVADVLAIAQIVAGLGLPFARTARSASIVLGAVYLLFALACIPAIVAQPSAYARYGSFFEWFSLVSGALAAYAVTETDGARSASLTTAARVGLGLCAVWFTLGQILYFRFTAGLVPTWIPPSQAFWTILTTAAFALAAIAMLIDRLTALASRLMALMLALFGVLVWVPMVAAHSAVHGNWSEFAENFLIAGATWVVAMAIERRDRSAGDVTARAPDGRTKSRSSLRPPPMQRV